MCEPHHSIVQFPDKDENDRPTGTLIDTIPTGEPKLWRPGGMVLCQRPDLISWAKAKIMSWFHFSKLGFGHSESIGQISPSARNRLPTDTKYEAKWWNRAVHLDGRYCGQEYDKSLALDCAKEYANQVSIGNLTKLRQFLTISLRQSIRPENYVHRFVDALNKKGQDTYVARLKQLLGIPSLVSNQIAEVVRNSIETVIKVMMGFTRKRNLLVPEWADDSNIWK